MALFQHYTVIHDILNKPHIYGSYTVAFVEQLSFDSLDTSEDKWLNKLNAPTFKS